MNIYFEKIILENFMSFEYAEIPLNNRGYVSVSGINENEDDVARSNGSGKSTIWEAVVWGLTGSTIRGTKDVKNLNNDKGALVKLYFNCDGNSYEILRSKDHSEYKTNLKIYINGEDKSGKGIRDSEKLLLQYLPELTDYLISSVIVLGQGLPSKFSNNSPSGRKDILEQLSKSDFMIADLKMRVSVRKAEIETELKEHKDTVLQCETKHHLLESQIQESTKIIEELECESIDTSIDNLQASLDKISEKSASLSKRVEDYQAEINLHNEQLSTLRSERAEKLAAIDKDYEAIVNSIRESQVEANTELKHIQSEISKYESLGDTCPTCGQHISEVDIVQTLNELAQCKSYYQTSVKISNEKLEECKKHREAACNNVTSEIDEKISVHSSHVMSLNEEMRQVSVQLQSAREEQIKISTELQGWQVKRASLDATINLHENIIKTNHDEQMKLSETILYNTNVIDNLEEHLLVVNKINTLVNRDFRGILLTNIINFIDKTAKDYCKSIFNHSKLDFILDGNSICIMYDSREYESLSGGERQKIDIILQLSIRDMLCNFLNFSSNILVMDEIFDNLDAIGCQKIIDVITTKLSDIDSIFIVTHHSDLSIPCDDELIVVKDTNGNSRLKEH